LKALFNSKLHPVESHAEDAEGRRGEKCAAHVALQFGHRFKQRETVLR